MGDVQPFSFTHLVREYISNTSRTWDPGLRVQTGRLNRVEEFMGKIGFERVPKAEKGSKERMFMHPSSNSLGILLYEDDRFPPDYLMTDTTDLLINIELSIADLMKATEEITSWLDEVGMSWNISYPNGNVALLVPGLFSFRIGLFPAAEPA